MAFGQSDSDRQPLYDSKSLAGFPSANFDATDDVLATTGFALPASDRTVTAVFLANNDSDDLQYILDAQTGRFICAHLSNTTGQLGVFDGAWRVGDAAIIGAQVVTWQFVGPVCVVYRNGEALPTVLTYAPIAIGGAVGIGGAYTGGAGTIFDGLIGDVMVHNRALSAERVLRLHDWLNRRYGDGLF